MAGRDAIMLFLVALLVVLGCGVWIGPALRGGRVDMELFTTYPAGDTMITTIWASSSR